MTVNNAGQVTNNTYNYYSNQTLETVTTTGGTATAAQPVDLQLPDDYARENTLQGLRDDLKDVGEVPPVAEDVGEIPTEAVEIPHLVTTGDFAFSEGCPADVTVDYGLGSMTLPMAPLCNGADIVGPLIVAAAALTAAFIAFGVKGSGGTA